MYCFFCDSWFWKNPAILRTETPVHIMKWDNFTTLIFYSITPFCTWCIQAQTFLFFTHRTFILGFGTFFFNWAFVQSGFVFLLLLINPGTLYFVVIHPQGSQSLFEFLPLLYKSAVISEDVFFTLPYFSRLISVKKITWNSRTS